MIDRKQGASMNAKRLRSRIFYPVLVTAAWAVVGCLQTDHGLRSSRSPLSQDDANLTKLKPEQVADVQVAMGRSLERSGDPEHAEVAYLEALKREPDQPDACLRLALLRDRQGKFSEALEYYQKALKGRPGSPDIFCDMGYSLYLQRRWPEAERNFRQAIALVPEHAVAHNDLGLLLAHTGRAEEALAEFRRAGCTDAQARANLAFACLMENQVDQARAQYRLALQADPKLASAQRGLREIDHVQAHSQLAASQPAGGLAKAAE